MKKINIILPIHNEEHNISKIFEEIINLKINNYYVEFIFVDDGSTDNSLREIQKLSKVYKSVKYLSFSKNFGHQIALTAGLDYADGDAIIMMDCDFQHPVNEIPKMIKMEHKKSICS